MAKVVGDETPSKSCHDGRQIVRRSGSMSFMFISNSLVINHHITLILRRLEHTLVNSNT